MAYEIPKLIKKCLKREAEFHRKQAEFQGQMERDFYVYEDSPTLKILCPTRWTLQAAFLRAILEEPWNFDEAVGMGTRQCQ